MAGDPLRCGDLGGALVTYFCQASKADQVTRTLGLDTPIPPSQVVEWAVSLLVAPNRPRQVCVCHTPMRSLAQTQLRTQPVLVVGKSDDKLKEVCPVYDRTWNHTWVTPSNTHLRSRAPTVLKTCSRLRTSTLSIQTSILTSPQPTIPPALQHRSTSR